MTGDSFFESAVAIIQAISSSEVTAYGEVTAEAGYPGAARAVGNLLRRTPDFPWWRIGIATGRLVPSHEAEQSQLLRSEGVTVANGRVPLR